MYNELRTAAHFFRFIVEYGGTRMADRNDRLSKWWKTEREKISGIPGTSKKIGYIWEYYKLWIIGIVFGIWFVTFAVRQYTTTLRDYWCFMVFANTYADAGDHSPLWEDYVEYAGFDLTEKAVRFNADSYFDYLKGVTGNSYFEAFVAYADSGTLDAIVMGRDSLTALGKTGRLLDLNSEECSSIRAKYGDRFLYAVPLNEDYGGKEMPVCIDISDSRLVSEYGIYSEPCALGIGALSGNVESVELFLDFLFEDPGTK